MVFIIIINVILFSLFVYIGFILKQNWRITFVFGLFLIFASANVFYYTHYIDNLDYYYEYRTQYWADFTPSLSGFFVGHTLKISNFIYRFSLLILFLLISFCDIVGPWAKLIITPMNYAALPNRWVNDICIQSTGTCGPCSLANILKYNGILSSENELTKEAFTTISGTESWYLARCARKRGFQTKFIYDKNHLKKNSIIGISFGKTGHFVAIVDIKDDWLHIVDSRLGLEKVKISEFHQKYKFEGMSLVLQK